MHMKKIHIVAKGLTMHDHAASTWFMINCNTKIAHSHIISSNSTWEYVFCFLSQNWNQIRK